MIDDLVRTASLLADRTRAEILAALLDGRAHTGSELARHIGVSTSTVSEHLAKLLDASLVDVEPQGRHRYWRLAGPAVATMLEALGATVGPAVSPARRPRAELLVARTCYDHLAGALAVAVFDALVTTGRLEPTATGLRLTSDASGWFVALGTPVSLAEPAVGRACLDWTERTHHLAGPAGSALLHAFLGAGWIRRAARSRRVDITASGREAFTEHFGWRG